MTLLIVAILLGAMILMNAVTFLFGNYPPGWELALNYTALAIFIVSYAARRYRDKK